MKMFDSSIRPSGLLERLVMFFIYSTTGIRKELTYKSLSLLRECITPDLTINYFPTVSSISLFSKTPKPDPFMQ